MASFASQAEHVIVSPLGFCSELHLRKDRHSGLSDLHLSEVPQFDLGDLRLSETRQFGLGDLCLSEVRQFDPYDLLNEFDCVCYSKAPVDCYNYYGHNGTRDSEVTHAFDGSVPLFLEGSSKERIEAIRSEDYRTLWEMITDAKFSIPNEDTSGKPHFLFGHSNPSGTSIFNWEKEHWYYTQGDCRYYLPAIERQVSFMYLQPLTVPRLMRYILTDKEDSVKVGSLKYDSGFCQEGLYGVNVIGLCLGFIHEDAPVNEVVVVPNVFGNDLAKTDGQYPDGDTSFPGWIKSMKPNGGPVW